MEHFNYRAKDNSLIFGTNYFYDGRGNIASEKSKVGGDIRSYTYDGQNQLTKAVYPDGTTYSYEYDTVGNIRSKKINNGTPIYYTYGDSKWADLLTAYNGEKIAYEGQTYNSENKTVTGTPISGNPTRYHNGSEYAFTWQQGRQLATASTGGTNISYSYDMAGVRSSKTVGSTTYKYDTLSGKVMRQTCGNDVIDFIYDESGQPYAMRCKNLTNNIYSTYYYVLNLQGDVVGLLNSIGVLIAEYSYDPWGKLLNIKTWGDLPGENELYLSVAEENPLRYRGYYYDTETGFYYLQSRYYDPAICRFINADTYTTTDADGLLSTNMFAYCANNPVNRSDPNGEDWQDIAKVGLAVAAIGLFTLSVVSTGGGALLLAGAGISASAATTAASATAAAGLATTGISILYASQESKGPTNPNKMQREVEKGKAPKEVDRVDRAHNSGAKGNQPHIHFKDGTAINRDGSISHEGKGTPNITRSILKWILKNNWGAPKF